MPSPFHLMRHTVACVSIFLPRGIGPSLTSSSRRKKEFWTAAVTFPLLCEVTSAPCSEFGRQTHFMEVGLCKRAHCTLSRSLGQFLAQFPHFSSFHLLSNPVLISPPFINDRTLILGGTTKRCLFDWLEQPPEKLRHHTEVANEAVMWN